jgi:hypothetical protein
MIGNSTLDSVAGFISFVGEAYDVAIRSNAKNAALLKGPSPKKSIIPAAQKPTIPAQPWKAR